MRVKIGGAFLDFMVDGYGDLEWSTDEHGCKEALVGVYLPRGRRHPLIRPGATFEVMAGSSRIWYGLLGQPDWREGMFTAYGLTKELDAFLALDGSGAATAIPSAAVDRAIGLGLGVTRGAGIPTTAYTSTASGVSTLADLISANSDELAQRYYVEADGVLDMAADPTTPAYYIAAGVVDLGITDQEKVTAVAVRYLDSVTSTYKTALRVDSEAIGNYRERPFNVTSLGPITTARANSIGDAALVKARARTGWTSSVELAYGDITNAGGAPIDLAHIKARRLVRIFGGHEDLTTLEGARYIEALIGEAKYADGARTISVTPYGASTQSLADAWEEMLLLALGRKAA